MRCMPIASQLVPFAFCLTVLGPYPLSWSTNAGDKTLLQPLTKVSGETWSRTKLIKIRIWMCKINERMIYMKDWKFMPENRGNFKSPKVPKFTDKFATYRKASWGSCKQRFRIAQKAWRLKKNCQLLLDEIKDEPLEEDGDFNRLQLSHLPQKLFQTENC